MDKLLFNDYKGDKTNIVKSLTHEIRRRISSGQVRNGYEFPSVNVMHKNMNISRTTITKVLKILSNDKYITLRNGRTAIVTWIYAACKNSSDPEIVINAQGPVNSSIGYTHQKDKLFHAKKTQFHKEHPLLDKTAVYPKLLEKSCSLLNNLHGTNYETDNIYYLEGTRSMYTCISTVLNKQAPFFLVPENFIMVDDILDTLHMKKLYLKVDEQGICVDEIARHCIKHKVKAVFFHSTVGFPFPYATSANRIAKLHELSQIYQFKVIECGGYLPRLVAKTNPILEAFKPDLENVIYLSKITRMQEDARKIIIVAASQDNITEFSKAAKDLGCPLDLSTAFATYEMLSGKSFETCYQGNNDALLALLDIIRQVFQYDDFWMNEMMDLDNEPVFYLKPRIGRFMRNAVKKLEDSKDVRAQLIDLGLYLKEKDPVFGLWIDLSYFIGQKNAYPKIQQLENTLRSIVKWQHVRE